LGVAPVYTDCIIIVIIQAMRMNDSKKRQTAIEAVDVLNDFISDCITPVNVYKNYFQYIIQKIDDINVRNNLLVSINRMCMSYLILTLDKWIEFYDRYNKIIPSDLHSECKNLKKELVAKDIRGFRHKHIGHIWDKKSKRPLYNSEIIHRFNEITQNDVEGFLKWVNDPSDNVFPKTVVSIVETVRDRLAQSFNIDYNEIANK
jgi:hypothetical protein